MFEQNSYDLHKAFHSKNFDEEKMNSWKRMDTVDGWRMQRILSNIDPVAKTNPGSVWLTVGDGSFGADAHYVHSLGCEVVATDISDFYLKRAFEAGFIPAYKAENAEALSFSSDSFDYVLCSHAYHHFPRPVIALYEMLRVARKGVILIEPHDTSHFGESLTLGKAINWFIRALKNYFFRLIGKEGNYKIGGYTCTGKGTYETVGNYEYYLSEREIEKIALGLNLDYIAVRFFNDYYNEGMEFEKAGDNSPLFRELKRQIAEKDKLARMGVIDYGQIALVVFKGVPDDQTTKALKEKGYQVIPLSKNPYV